MPKSVVGTAKAKREKSLEANRGKDENKESVEVMNTSDPTVKSAKAIGKQVNAKNVERIELTQVSENSFDCFDCKNPVLDRDDGVQCEICDGWYHCLCEKLSKQTYEALMADSVNKMNMLHWYCIHRSKGVKKVLTGMAALKQRQDKMELEISTIKKDLVMLVSRNRLDWVLKMLLLERSGHSESRLTINKHSLKY